MRGLHKTDIELLMEEALAKEGIEAVQQFPIRSKYGYIADFAIPSKNLIIECDGEAWHKLMNAHDRKRDAFLKSQGWKVLRFKGQDIKTNMPSCLMTIKSHL